MSKITNDGLTRSGTRCFVAVYPYGNSGRQRVNNNSNVIITKNAHNYSDAVANKTLQGHFTLLLICNRRAKCSARNDERPADVSHSLETRPEEKGVHCSVPDETSIVTKRL